MYKKEVKIKGKKYTYYYYNLRKEGKVKNICLGGDKKLAIEKEKALKEERNLNLLEGAPEPVKIIKFSDISSSFLIILIILFGFGFFYLFNDFTGLTVYDNIVSLEVNDYVSKDALVFLNVNLEEYNKSINEFGLELVNDSYYISNLNVDINSFELDLENGSYNFIVSLIDNESLVAIKSKEIIVGVEEEVVNVTLQEEIIEEDIENVTLPENITIEEEVIENVTVEENVTNISLGVIYGVKIELVEPIIINKNVKWRKTIKLNESSNNLTVEIPKEAFNLSVKKIVNDETFEIDKNKLKVIEDNVVKDIKDTNLISGNVVFERTFLEKTFMKKGSLIYNILNWFEDITGYSILDEDLNLIEENTILVIEEKGNKFINLVIEENINEVMIEYETPGPVSSEEIINENKKIVTISSDIHYEKVIAYTSINESKEENIKLYWLVNDSRILVNDVKYEDSNNNSLIDKIEWIVPYLSNQTYEISITILNVQSYPTVGGNWTVMFNTVGVDDLFIRAVNGTTFTEIPDNPDTINDLEFLELKCENNTLENFFLVDSDGNLIPYKVYKIKRRIEEIGKRLEEMKNE